jgi:hypothetical protein
MKRIILVAVAVLVAGWSARSLACSSMFECGLGEVCINVNTLEDYHGFDNAGVCYSRRAVEAAREARREGNGDQGCCSDHGGILPNQMRYSGGPIMCNDFAYSPTCTWK